MESFPVSGKQSLKMEPLKVWMRCVRKLRRNKTVLFGSHIIIQSNPNRTGISKIAEMTTLVQGKNNWEIKLFM